MIHVIIQTERRASPRELAIVMPVTEQSGIDGEGRPVFIQTGTQLHTMGHFIADLNDPQIVYAAEWDEVSPYITILKGREVALNMGYMGWPTAESEAVNP